MSDEQIVKFKAWHEGISKMFPAEELGIDQLTISPDGKGFINVSGQDVSLSEYYHDMIPLQYIGIHDVNDNEIYRGDIITFAKTYNSKTYVGIVQYHNDVAGFMIETIHGEYWHSFEFGLGTVDLKVIGNKYENPDLLGGHT